MNGNWAYNWVQIMSHNKVPLIGTWGVLSMVCIYGLSALDFTGMMSSMLLLGMGLGLMSITVSILLDSVKTLFIQLWLSLYVLAMTFGVLGWLGVALTENTVLGLVVLMTLMTSNLVHILSTLLRGMARGGFQYDAVPESIHLNNGPILLSNLTTALGFIFVGWYDAQLMDLAIVVSVGVTISYLTTLTWLPMLLLNWLLEFRVGNGKDRHGFSFVAKWLIAHPGLRAMLLWTALILSAVLTYYSWMNMADLVEELMWLAGSFIVLFILFWKSIKLALINVIVNLLALLLTVNVFILVLGLDSISLLLLMIPLGLIVDDGIHFFSRYLRAQQSLFSETDSAVRFAMASVGRPIWITSWVLLIGLMMLLLSDSQLVQQASIIAMVALVIATALILLIVPAVLIALNQKKA
ncbi:MAG: MMPL family transporter [Gammaproteobacteria bacterium]|nr:MMPL family transporter [Gammaproteobacteria bacterium]